MMTGAMVFTKIKHSWNLSRPAKNSSGRRGHWGAKSHPATASLEAGRGPCHLSSLPLSVWWFCRCPRKAAVSMSHSQEPEGPSATASLCRFPSMCIFGDARHYNSSRQHSISSLEGGILPLDAPPSPPKVLSKASSPLCTWAAGRGAALLSSPAVHSLLLLHIRWMEEGRSKQLASGDAAAEEAVQTARRFLLYWLLQNKIQLPRSWFTYH